MNLNSRLFSIVLAIAMVIGLNGLTVGQANVPVHIAPEHYSVGGVYPLTGAPQHFDQGVVQADLVQPDAFAPTGFAAYMNERYPLNGSPVDYTPELIGTYGPRANFATATRIGVETVTDYALGHGKHSPLVQGNVAQASFFAPVGQARSVENFALEPGIGYSNYASDPAPRLFGDNNIGGGRSIARAFVDPHWTRMVLVYGGFGNSQDNGSDVFDGRASSTPGVVGIDIGRRHSKFMRSSIDFTFRRGDLENSGSAFVQGVPANVQGDLKVYSLMKNFHLDLAQRGRFRPYIGVGIGAGVLDTDANFGNDTVTVQDEVAFAYQIMGGVARNISSLAAVYAEYRFFSVTDVDVTTNAGNSEGGFTSHDLLFGLRFGY